MSWTAAAFHEWHSKTNDPVKKQRAFDDLTSNRAKEYREWWTFRCFARASILDIDPRTIENRNCPEPDILCKVSGSGYYFEMGELTDERIAKRAGIAAKAGADIHSGSFSQDAPLEKMIFQKCAKTYSLNRLPASLLLHYDIGHQVPFPEVLSNFLSASRERIVSALSTSPFQAIWFFDGWEGKVLGTIGRRPSDNPALTIPDAQNGSYAQR